MNERDEALHAQLQEDAQVVAEEQTVLKRCDTCEGAGVIECEECEGTGEVDCDECGPGDEECDFCDRDGTVTCDSCGGSGDEPCYTCEGQGEVESK